MKIRQLNLNNVSDLDVESYIRAIGWNYEGAVKHKKFSYPNKTPIMLSKGELSIGQKRMALIEAEKILSQQQKERLDEASNFSERMKTARKLNAINTVEDGLVKINPLRVYQETENSVTVKLVKSEKTQEKRIIFLDKKQVRLDNEGFVVAISNEQLEKNGIKIKESKPFIKEKSK
jgi:co-chaperonin GroES (HSP10)